MKKILLLIAITFFIFQMVILAIDINIGNAAIERNSSAGVMTIVDKLSPANGSGTITSIEIWCFNPLSDCEVATFYVVSGNNLSTRDTEAIGNVASGAKQTFEVDLDVVEGDYIGIYYATGNIMRTLGSDGYWFRTGDSIPCTNVGFTVSGTGSAISLHGTGTTAVGWSHKWNTLTIGKWNTKEFTKWNGLE